MSEDKGIADFLERKLWNGNLFICLKYFFKLFVPCSKGIQI